MLVLGVNEGDYVMIDDKVKIRVLKTGAVFRLAIDAPKEMVILRKSLYEMSNPDADDSEYEEVRQQQVKNRKPAAK